LGEIEALKTPLFAAIGNAKEVTRGHARCDGCPQSVGFAKSWQVEVAACLLPRLQGADRRRVILPEPRLKHLCQVDRRPLGDEKLMLFEHLLDLLCAIHRSRIDLEVVPLDFANALAGLGLLQGGQ
jgi:hypothetical protein